MTKLFNKKFFILLPILMVIMCAVVVFANGRTYTVKSDLPVGGSLNIEDYSVISEDTSVIDVDEIYLKGSTIYAKFRYIAPGRAFIDFTFNGEDFRYIQLYAHSLGIITESYFLGNSTGSWIIPLCITIYLTLALIALIIKYGKDRREDLYQYKNITTFGLIVFIAFLLIITIFKLVNFQGLYSLLYSLSGAANGFSILTFPIAFVLSILIMFSNINLMRNEGRNLKNMLGFILGLLLCIGILAPGLFSDFIYNHTSAEVHKESGIGRHLVLYVESAVSIFVAYLECILIGTIVLSLKAAKHIPRFDKGFILILGCKIKNNGTLTKLLQGRADRAVEFADMQRKETGKDIIFVPSGGKGSDEPIAEGDAVGNYLRGLGVPEERILVENKSTDTFENFKYSNELIKEICGDTEPSIAFSTTNYHVFRSGMYASKQGIKAEGIGSKTRRYFWVNAFVREFVATLSSERKRHIRIVAALLLIMLLMVVVLYLSVQV